MDYEFHRTTILAHYQALVINRHWRQYVQHRVREMARDCPGLYGDFPDKVEATLTAWKTSRALVSQPDTRSPKSSPGATTAQTMP